MPIRCSTWARVAAFGLLPLGLVLAGCGDKASTGHQPTGSATTASVADGDWLLRFNTAEGADGELSRAVLVSYDPTTGAARVRRLPGVLAGDSYADGQALLISADHAQTLLDTRVEPADARHGRVTVYSVTGPGKQEVPVRAWSGQKSLVPAAAAFDPAQPGLLRVVDSANRVWKVDLAARTATQVGRLPLKSGWIFGNGFDKNTGEPYIESIDSEATVPAGNGDDDVRPVARQGGTVLYYDGTPVAGLPTVPCGFTGGFTTAAGETWLFCADTPSLQAYRLPKGGTAWQKFGTASRDVLPGAASELAVVLPPVG